MTDDDVLFRFRLRLFGLAHELGSVRAACRAMGVHSSTYYRWKHQVDQGGLEMLRPRERRASGVYRVLRRHGPETRTKRLGLELAMPAHLTPCPGSRSRSGTWRLPILALLVQMDAFAIGRLSGSKGMVWQYTAIDVASSYVWAELHTSPRNPTAHWCSRLAEEVARELATQGWKLRGGDDRQCQRV